jgi:predicted nucleic acid-binding protein
VLKINLIILKLECHFIQKFKVEFDENVTLYTIRHFNENAAQTVEENKVVLLKQVSRETMQVVTKKFSILFSTS